VQVPKEAAKGKATLRIELLTRDGVKHGPTDVPVELR
jgi:hypothetical protein